MLSNLYAARVFSEHPLALWSLDDEVYFNTLLNQQDFYINNWSILDNNAEWILDNYIPPNIPTSASTATLSKTSSASVTYSEIRSSAIPISNIDQSKNSVCISSWVWEYGSLVEGYEFGFIYNNGSATFVDSATTTSIGSQTWQEIHHTSEIPNDAISITPFIKVNYIEEFGSSTEYKVMFNSMAVAQWSEQYLNTGGGVSGSVLYDPLLDSLLPTDNYKVVGLDAYGFQDSDNALCFIDNNKLLAYNTNFPMVFGSNNVIRIKDPVTNNMPSMLFPGKGFLNKSGKYSDITAEFWVRLNPHGNIIKRFFGPIGSTDGLYINNEFLELRIGTYNKAYFVGKWYRPMLIDIRYSSQSVSILINGDVVIDLQIDINNIDFPNKVYDWVGFFSNADINPFELDCVAIYPYIVSDQIAKKRFIYGQAVQNPEFITNSYGGESFYVDFPFAQYTSTINYPDMNTWSSGYFNNLNANSKYIGFQDYKLPEFKFTGDTASLNISADIRNWEDYDIFTWYSLISQSWQNTASVGINSVNDIFTDNFLIQSGSALFFKMKPNSGYDNINGAIEFDNINTISEKLASVHGVFEAPLSLSSTPETLMYFYNSVNLNNFKITINNQGLKYIYNDQVLETFPISASSTFTAGIDLDKININYSNIIGNFFSNPQNVSLSLLGDGSSTFTGKLYQFTFNNTFLNNKETLNLYNSNGIAHTEANLNSMIYIGNYTLKPILTSTGLSMNIGSSGYWEDSIPLSYFGKRVLSKTGLTYYDLDMIQFNIDFPSFQIVDSSSSVSHIDSTHLKTYITLQHVDDVGKISYLQYYNTEDVKQNRVLDFDNTDDVINTKFDVVDGTIIFPPKELVDFKDYYITIHIEAKVESIQTKPLQIKRMSLSSLAVDDGSFYYIGTKSGNKISPTSRYNNTYSLKDKNPFTTYVNSTPYLYLTGDSGISLLPYESSGDRAFSVPINSNKKEEYYLGGVQFWGMYNKDEVILGTQKIGRLITTDKTYDFYIQGIDNGKRGIIKAYDAETGYVSNIVNLENENISYYQDGVKIKNPIVQPLLWTSIIITFGEKIPLNSVSGQMEFYEGFLYNNISVYQKSSNVLGSVTGSRNWLETKTSQVITESESIDIENQWEDWLPLEWFDVYSPVEINTYTIDGESILGSYVGTTGAISDDISSLMINSEGVDVISDVTWNTTIAKPV
jgi:hypothetical protein